MKLKPIEQQVVAVRKGGSVSVPLEQAPHGYEIFKHKKESCIKVVLKPGQIAQQIDRSLALPLAS